MAATRRLSSREWSWTARGIAALGLCAALAACTFGRSIVADNPTVTPSKGGFSVLVKTLMFRAPHILADPQVAVADGFVVVEEADPTVSAVPDPQVLEAHAAVMRGGGRYQVGAPYEIAGKLYEPHEDPDYNEVGMASWYGPSFHSRLTANGEIFDSAAISAAHPTLPLPSYVRVTNLRNNRSIVVRVNDRGPYSGNRLLDVSEQTAALLGFRRRGTTQVRVEYIGRAPLEGEDKATLLATYREGDSQPNLVLASHTPLPANALAYSTVRPPWQAEEAIENISVSLPAAERILMAFQAAEEVEE